MESRILVSHFDKPTTALRIDAFVLIEDFAKACNKSLSGAPREANEHGRALAQR